MSTSDGRRSAGFTLIEVSIVVGVMLVVSAISIPPLLAIVSNGRLHAGVSSMSGLLQNCRMLAVKRNRTLSAHFEAEGDSIVGYVKNADDASARAATDPQVKWEAPVAMMGAPTGGDAPAAISNTVLGFTPESVTPSFNTRGLPCTYSGGACANHGYVYYFKDTSRLSGQGWAALSITPAGRIKKWFWSGNEWID